MKAVDTATESTRTKKFEEKDISPAARIRKKPKPTTKPKKEGLMLHEELEKRGFKGATAIHDYLVAEYQKLHEAGKLEGMALKDLKKIGMDLVQELFGIKPKPGVLTKNDIKFAQMFIKKLGKDFWVNNVFLSHFTEGIPLRDENGKIVFDKNDQMVIDQKTKELATGLPQVIQSERPTQKNGLTQVRDKFYESVGRGKNLKLKKLKKFDDDYFYEELGILADNPNLYKKSTNISATIRGFPTMVLQNMASQASREVIGPGRTFDQLRDGIPSTLFSEEMRVFADFGEATEAFAALPEIFQRLNPYVNDYTKDLLRASITGALPHWKDKKIKITNKKGEKIEVYAITHLTNGLDKIISRYVNQAKRFKKINKKQVDITEYVMDRVLHDEKVLMQLFDARVNGKRQTIINKLWEDKDSVKRTRNGAPLIVEEIMRTAKTPKEGIEKIIKYLIPLYVGSGIIADGRFEVDKFGNPYYIGDKAWDKKVAEYRKKHKGKGSPTNRRKSFKNNGDFILNAIERAFGGRTLKDGTPILKIGLKPPDKGGKIAIDLNNVYYKGDKIKDIDRTLLSQTSESMINKIKSEGEKTVRTASEKEAQEAMYFVHDIMEFYNKTDFLKDGATTVMMLNGLNSDMKSPMRRAANLLYVFDGYDKVKNPGKDLEYEHMIPANWMMIRHAVGVSEGKITRDNVQETYKDYTVAIIPTEMNDVLNESGYVATMPVNYELGDGSWRRYYNDRTLTKNNIVAIRKLGTKTVYFGKKDERLSKKWSKDHVNHKILERAIQRGRMSEDAKGITILDFDDTLATTKSLVKFTAPDGTKGTLNAEEYATQYQDLKEQGYIFDFTEFDKVVKAKLAPLFNKALKLQEKFGSKNMFILTARPEAAQQAIFDFLKANGLNIPLKNIVTLGNSTAEAKALWVAEKVGEGYNDFYFADDALQNIQAVQNMLDQFDVKSKIQQARTRFSENMDISFNDILEDITGIDAKKRFSAIKARKRGDKKGRFRLFIPPSHEDFAGLLYNFMGKGEKGNAHRKFFEKALIRPLNRAFRELDTAKQSIANDYKSLNKEFPNIKDKLTKKTPDGDFTYSDAIRVYLWNKHGHKIPGLSKTDQQNLVDLVMADGELQTYAETLNIISKREDYVKPTDGWESGDIRMDLDDATGRVGRSDYFAEFNENADIIFSEENLNKIEAIYGKDFREALEDMLYRIQTGRNRPKGNNSAVNIFVNYLNGSVGVVMFLNMRSAVLQQLSIVNYINFADNNIFAAGKAFANLPQYCKDFAMIFNSDMLKQRRGGIRTDVNAADLVDTLKGSRFPGRVLIAKLLQLGFTPTQIGDSFAIAAGGAPFYRNRVNTYLKEGLNQKEAETRAWTDFQDITQSTQQSARPDMVSQQQASPIGKFILNFQNITSQYNRFGKKAFLDIYNRRITPPNKTLLQSDISNASRIMYYFVAQNLIFYSLQTALFAALFSDDEEDEKFFTRKRERVVNGTIDSILRGTGWQGAVIATLKNMAMKFAAQRDVKYNPDESSVLMEMLNVSPVIGIKGREISNAEKTLNYNKKVIKEMETFDIDNPMWSAVTNYIEGTTNIPVNRLYKKTQNVRQSLNNEHAAWQRVLMFLGWSQYNLGIKNPEVEKVKAKLKKPKKKKKERKMIIR